jgi:hypothetical protein
MNSDCPGGPTGTSRTAPLRTIRVLREAARVPPMDYRDTSNAAFCITLSSGSSRSSQNKLGRRTATVTTGTLFLQREL